MSSWETALAQVATDLNDTIDGTGSFNYDLVRVYRDVVERDEAETPSVIMLPGRIRESRRASNNRRFLMLPLTLAGVLAFLDTDKAKNTQLNNLGEDILLAMTQDSNFFHNATVLENHFLGMEAIFNPEERTGLVMVDFELEIHGTWSAP